MASTVAPPVAGLESEVAMGSPAIDAPAPPVVVPPLTRKPSAQQKDGLGMMGLHTLKTRRSNNTAARQGAMEPGMPQLRHLRVTSGTGDGGATAAYPSPFTQQVGRAPESPSGGGHNMHPMAFAPYMLYPVASMTYPMADPGSPHASPSPLMGSPVGTPTAMMFPQTPFAGAHQTPFYGPAYPTEGALSPHASQRVSYFHPMYNNFQFMGLQSLASVPAPPGTVSLACHPSIGQPRLMTAPSKQQLAAYGMQPGPGAEGGDYSGMPPGHPGVVGPGRLNGHGMPGGPPNVHAPGAPPPDLKSMGAGLLMGQPSYTAMGVPPHIATQLDDTDQPLSDAALLSGMFGAMHLRPMSPHMPYGYMDAQLLAAQQQAALAQMNLQQQLATMAAVQHANWYNAAAAAGRPDLGPATPPPPMPAPGPYAPLSPGLGAPGMPMAGWSHAPGMQAGMHPAGLPGTPGPEMWDAMAMYGMLGLGGAPPGMPGQGAPDMMGMFGPVDAMGMPQRRPSRMSHNMMGMQPRSMMVPGASALPHLHMPQANMMHLVSAQGLPHVATQAAGSSSMSSPAAGGPGSTSGMGMLRRGGPGGGSVGSPSMTPQMRSRSNTANGAVDSKLSPDGAPRLNARQRRTLRRAKERAIKGLMEAGRLLLQRATGAGELGVAASAGSAHSQSSMAGAEDDKSGSDREGAEPTSGASASAADSQSTSYYIHAAMQVAGGSHGPEAAADASQVLSKVAAELEEMGDLGDLIAQLATKKGVESVAGVDDALIRDLQIIQNLMGALRSPGLQSAVGPSRFGTSPR